MSVEITMLTYIDQFVLLLKLGQNSHLAEVHPPNAYILSHFTFVPRNSSCCQVTRCPVAEKYVCSTPNFIVRLVTYRGELCAGDSLECVQNFPNCFVRNEASVRGSCFELTTHKAAYCDRQPRAV